MAEQREPRPGGWPTQVQVIVEIAIVSVTVLAFATVCYLNFFVGQVRAPFAVPRYYELGDYEKFPPVGGRFDLNKTVDNFDSSPLDNPRGQVLPIDMEGVTVLPQE